MATNVIPPAAKEALWSGAPGLAAKLAPAKGRKDETYKFEIRKTNLECPPESMRYQIQYSWRRKRECPRPGSHTSQRARCMRHPSGATRRDVRLLKSKFAKRTWNVI